MAMAFIDYALMYAGFGWHVLPLHPKTKDPATPHAYKDATTDASTITAWWEANPSYNIGIATGASHLLVIDNDEHPERNISGLRTLKEWCSKHGNLPATLCANSGSGGLHMFYRTDKALSCSTDHTEDKHIGIDIRAQGGYIVAPPSIHPNGSQYEWQISPEDMEPTEADKHVLEFVQWVQENSKKATTSKDGKQSFELPERITEGSRHDVLNSYAASLRSKGYHDDVINGMLHFVNKTRCEPPYPEDELQAIIDYWCAKGPGHDGEGLFIDERTVTALRGIKSLENIRTKWDYAKVLDGMGITKHDINDKGLSRLFACIHGDVVHYVPEWATFTTFNGMYWQTEGGTQLVDRYVKLFTDAVQVWTNTIEDDDEKKSAQKLAYKYNDHNRRVHLREDVKSELAISKDAFDRNPRLLNVHNGTLDFSHELVTWHQHDPADLITQIAPVTFDKGADCPRFKQMLYGCFEGDMEVAEYMQKLSGVIVAGDTTRDFFSVLGKATRSGKGTVTACLKSMLGESDNGYAVSIMRESLATKQYRNSSGPTPDLASMKGKRLIVTSESNEQIELDANLIKNLSGGDVISARYLRRNLDRFALSGIIVMLVNYYPSLDDPSIFDSGRVVCVPFNHHFAEDERIIGLRESLKGDPSEMSGLLNWCIHGYQLVQRNGLTPPIDAQNMVQEFLQESEPVGAYVQERLVPAEGRNVSGHDVYVDYKSWLGSRDPISDRAFYSRLRFYVQIAQRATVDGVRRRNVVLNHVLAAK